MTPLAAPQCYRCRHFDPDGWRCPAFPGAAIPALILLNVRDHREPYPGDGDVRFDPLPGKRSPLDPARDA